MIVYQQLHLFKSLTPVDFAKIDQLSTSYNLDEYDVIDLSYVDWSSGKKLICFFAASDNEMNGIGDCEKSIKVAPKSPKLTGLNKNR